jgi:hypothetical protein
MDHASQSITEKSKITVAANIPCFIKKCMWALLPRISGYIRLFISFNNFRIKQPISINIATYNFCDIAFYQSCSLQACNVMNIAVTILVMEESVASFNT